MRRARGVMRWSEGEGEGGCKNICAYVLGSKLYIVAPQLEDQL